MPWNLNNDRPIYAQIIERIQIRIVSGYYQSGDKIPSVRELAAEASVNPNTMQKALTELERSGLIITMRTSGRMVTEDKEMIQEVKQGIAKQEIKAFLEKMRELGLDATQTANLVLSIEKEGDR